MGEKADLALKPNNPKTLLPLPIVHTNINTIAVEMIAHRRIVPADHTHRSLVAQVQVDMVVGADLLTRGVPAVVRGQAAFSLLAAFFAAGPSGRRGWSLTMPCPSVFSTMPVIM